MDLIPPVKYAKKRKNFILLFRKKLEKEEYKFAFEIEIPKKVRKVLNV